MCIDTHHGRKGLGFDYTGVIDIVKSDILRFVEITETCKIVIIVSLYNAMYALHVGGLGAVVFTGLYREALKQTD